MPKELQLQIFSTRLLLMRFSIGGYFVFNDVTKVRTAWKAIGKSKLLIWLMKYIWSAVNCCNTQSCDDYNVNLSSVLYKLRNLSEIDIPYGSKCHFYPNVLKGLIAQYLDWILNSTYISWGPNIIFGKCSSCQK